MMKNIYNNTLMIITQCKGDFFEFLQSIVNDIPKILKSRIDSGELQGITHKKGMTWEFFDDNSEFVLSVGKSGYADKDFVSISLNGLSNDRLSKWSEFESEKVIATVNIYLSKKGAKRSFLKLNYKFNLRLYKGNYIVRITTDSNTQIKQNKEILESNEKFAKMHENLVNMSYVADVQQITGIDKKKENKFNIL